MNFIDIPYRSFFKLKGERCQKVSGTTYVILSQTHLGEIQISPFDVELCSSLEEPEVKKEQKPIVDTSAKIINRDGESFSPVDKNYKQIRVRNFSEIPVGAEFNIKNIACRKVGFNSYVELARLDFTQHLGSVKLPESREIYITPALENMIEYNPEQPKKKPVAVKKNARKPAKRAQVKTPVKVKPASKLKH